MIKLTKQGFSAIEIVVAVVAVVVVAGLGYFAYSSWSGGSSSNSETTQSTEAKEDGEITSDSEAEAAQADAGSWASYGPLKIDSKRKMTMYMCKVANVPKVGWKLKVLWVVSPKWNTSRTVHSPWVSFNQNPAYRNGYHKSFYGSQNWWLNSLNQATFTIIFWHAF